MFFADCSAEEDGKAVYQFASPRTLGLLKERKSEWTRVPGTQTVLLVLCVAVRAIKSSGYAAIQR